MLPSKANISDLFLKNFLNWSPQQIHLQGEEQFFFKYTVTNLRKYLEKNTF